jgi:hypothetical protein
MTGKGETTREDERLRGHVQDLHASKENFRERKETQRVSVILTQMVKETFSESKKDLSE